MRLQQKRKKYFVHSCTLTAKTRERFPLLVIIRHVDEQDLTRNLEQYLDYYRELPYERIAESFRRQEILSVIRGLQTKRLGEIGCGLDSVFNYLDVEIGGFIVEPISQLLAQQVDLRDNVETYCTTLEKLEDYNDYESYNEDYLIMTPKENTEESINLTGKFNQIFNIEASNG